MDLHVKPEMFRTCKVRMCDHPMDGDSHSV